MRFSLFTLAVFVAAGLTAATVTFQRETVPPAEDCRLVKRAGHVVEVCEPLPRIENTAFHPAYL